MLCNELWFFVFVVFVGLDFGGFLWFKSLVILDGIGIVGLKFFVKFLFFLLMENWVLVLSLGCWYVDWFMSCWEFLFELECWFVVLICCFIDFWVFRFVFFGWSLLFVILLVVLVIVFLNFFLIIFVGFEWVMFLGKRVLICFGRIDLCKDIVGNL